MTDLNEDRTVAYDGHSMDKGGARSSLVDVPRARLICTDRAQVEGALPGEGVINLVPGAEQTVGRGETCTYPIGSRKLSRQHARVFAGVGAWGVEDLNSTNGVRVNEDKVQTAWLKHGDIVRFGPIPFRFEVERPDAAAAMARPQPAALDGEGEHTMIFTGAQGARAAEVMLKAVREADKGKEAPPEIVPVTPTKATKAVAPAKGIDRNRIMTIVGGIALVAVLAVVGVLYYPSFQRGQQISAMVDRDSPIIKRVIDRARDASGAADATRLDDIKLLQPVVLETNNALLSDLSDSREIADIYARSRFLVFEREFSNLLTRPDPAGEFLREASRKAFELRDRLDKIGYRLPPPAPGADAGHLKAAADLADMARILVSYHSFARQFAQIGPGLSAPTLDQLTAVDERKKDYIQYRRSYNQVLSSDYRLFNAVVHDVEDHDFTLVSRWREFLASK